MLFFGCGISIFGLKCCSDYVILLYLVNWIGLFVDCFIGYVLFRYFLLIFDYL